MSDPGPPSLDAAPLSSEDGSQPLSHPIVLQEELQQEQHSLPSQEVAHITPFVPVIQINGVSDDSHPAPKSDISPVQLPSFLPPHFAALSRSRTPSAGSQPGNSPLIPPSTLLPVASPTSASPTPSPPYSPFYFDRSLTPLMPDSASPSPIGLQRHLDGEPSSDSSNPTTPVGGLNLRTIASSFPVSGTLAHVRGHSRKFSSGSSALSPNLPPHLQHSYLNMLHPDTQASNPYGQFSVREDDDDEDQRKKDQLMCCAQLRNQLRRAGMELATWLRDEDDDDAASSGSTAFSSSVSAPTHVFGIMPPVRSKRTFLGMFRGVRGIAMAACLLLMLIWLLTGWIPFFSSSSPERPTHSAILGPIDELTRLVEGDEVTIFKQPRASLRSKHKEVDLDTLPSHIAAAIRGGQTDVALNAEQRLRAGTSSSRSKRIGPSAAAGGGGESTPFNLVTIWKDVGPFEGDLSNEKRKAFHETNGASALWSLQLTALHSWLSIIPARNILIFMETTAGCKWLKSHAALARSITKQSESLLHDGFIASPSNIDELHCLSLPPAPFPQFRMPLIQTLMGAAEEEFGYVLKQTTSTDTSTTHSNATTAPQPKKKSSSPLVGWICGTCVLDKNLPNIIEMLDAKMEGRSSYNSDEDRDAEEEWHQFRLPPASKIRASTSFFLASSASVASVETRLYAPSPFDEPNYIDVLHAIRTSSEMAERGERVRNRYHAVHAHPLNVQPFGMMAASQLMPERRMFSTASLQSFPAAPLPKVKRGQTPPQQAPWQKQTRRMLNSGTSFGLTSPMGLDFFLYHFESGIGGASFPPFIAGAGGSWDAFILAHALTRPDVAVVDVSDMELVTALITKLEAEENTKETQRLADEKAALAAATAAAADASPDSPPLPPPPVEDLDEKFGLGSKYNARLFTVLLNGGSANTKQMPITSSTVAPFYSGSLVNADYRLIGTGCPQDCTLVFNSNISMPLLFLKVNSNQNRGVGSLMRAGLERWHELGFSRESHVSLVGVSSSNLDQLLNWLCWTKRVLYRSETAFVHREEDINSNINTNAAAKKAALTERRRKLQRKANRARRSIKKQHNFYPSKRDNFLFLAYDVQSYETLLANNLPALLQPDAPQMCTNCLSHPTSIKQVLFQLNVMEQLLTHHFHFFWSTLDYIWLNNPYLFLSIARDDTVASTSGDDSSVHSKVEWDIQVKWNEVEATATGSRSDSSQSFAPPAAPYISDASFGAAANASHASHMSLFPPLMFVRSNKRTTHLFQSLVTCETDRSFERIARYTADKLRGLVSARLPFQEFVGPSCFRSLEWSETESDLMKHDVNSASHRIKQSWTLPSVTTLLQTAEERKISARNAYVTAATRYASSSGHARYTNLDPLAFSTLHAFTKTHSPQARGVFPAMLHLGIPEDTFASTAHGGGQEQNQTAVEDLSAQLAHWDLLAYKSTSPVTDSRIAQQQHPQHETATCSFIEPRPLVSKPLIRGSTPHPFTLMIRILISTDYDAERLEMLLSSLSLAIYPSSSDSNVGLITLQVRVDVPDRSKDVQRALGELDAIEEATMPEMTPDEFKRLSEVKSAYATAQKGLQDCLLVLKRFQWNHGSFTVLVEKTHVGLTGLWATKWKREAKESAQGAQAAAMAGAMKLALPKNEGDMLLVLPDDVIVSPYFFQLLRQIVQRYYLDTLYSHAQREIHAQQERARKNPANANEKDSFHERHHVPHFDPQLMGISLANWRTLSSHTLQNDEGLSNAAASARGSSPSSLSSSSASSTPWFRQRMRYFLEDAENEELDDTFSAAAQPSDTDKHEDKDPTPTSSVNNRLLFRSQVVGSQGLLFFPHHHAAFLNWLQSIGFDRKTSTARKELGCVPFSRLSGEWLSRPKQVWQAFLHKFLHQHAAYFLHLNLGKNALLAEANLGDAEGEIEGGSASIEKGNGNGRGSLLTKEWLEASQLPHSLHQTPLFDLHLQPIVSTSLLPYRPRIYQKLSSSDACKLAVRHRWKGVDQSIMDSYDDGAPKEQDHEQIIV